MTCCVSGAGGGPPVPAAAVGRGLPAQALSAGGPVAVVYPDAVWYSYVDNSDIDEIVESQLVMKIRSWVTFKPLVVTELFDAVFEEL